MPARPKARRRSLQRLDRIHRADLDSSPSAVAADSTFLPVEVLHNILRVGARRPSPGCKVAVGIHIVPADRTVPVGHRNRHPVVAVGKA